MILASSSELYLCWNSVLSGLRVSHGLDEICGRVTLSEGCLPVCLIIEISLGCHKMSLASRSVPFLSCYMQPILVSRDSPQTVRATDIATPHVGDNQYALDLYINKYPHKLQATFYTAPQLPQLQLTMTTPIPFSEPPYLLGLPSPYYTPSHLSWQKACRAFITSNLTSHALDWEREELVPPSVFSKFAAANMLIPTLPSPLPIEWCKRLGLDTLLGGLKVEEFDYLHFLIHADEVCFVPAAGRRRWG